MWRVCSLLVTLVSLLPFLIPLSMFCFNWLWATHSKPGRMTHTAKILRTLFFICMFVYLVARIILVQMFLYFRSMPADVYVAVEWLQYVPHI